jgi:hypothetical protein
MISQDSKIKTVVLEGDGRQLRAVTRELSLAELRQLSDIGSARVCAPCMAFEAQGQLPQEEAFARQAIEAVTERLLNCREHLDKPMPTVPYNNMVGMLQYITRALHSAQVYLAQQRFGAAKTLAETLNCDFDRLIAGLPVTYPPLQAT